MKKEFNRHDNIDYEVVEVSRSALLLNLKQCAENACLPTQTIGYLGISLSLYATVFFTETARGFWTISGETIKATFLVGAIVATVATLVSGYKWYSAKDKHSPESIIDSLSPVKEQKIIGLLPAPSISIVKQVRRKLSKVAKTKY